MFSNLLSKFKKIAIFSTIFLALSSCLEAQPVLNFKRVINNWPTVELYFSISCNGEPAYFTDKRYFKVFEDGIEIGEFELWCPDLESRCAISVALVFDASGSMIGPGQSGAKAAGLAFIDLMDGVQDEAAIIWFASNVVVAQGMTIYKDLLTNAVNNLPASGATAVWDGAYTGVMNLINDGVNPCRAVIVMTDGGDNMSTRTPAEIIALANRNRIRVFTIGLGSGIQSAILKNIADLTGGRYYETPNPAQLAAIYEEISKLILDGFQECLITYTANCPDGSTRRVDLTVHSFCGGSDTKTKTYKAPKDTSVYLPLDIRLNKQYTRGGQEVKVQMELLTPLTTFAPILYPSTFVIKYDESCIKFKDIKTPRNSLLDSIPITITPIVGGIIFETQDKKIVDINTIPALLAELTFMSSDPDGKDTVCCDVIFESWTFSAGCFYPVLINGEICIIPRVPKIDCDIQLPQQLNWERTLKDYNPNPFVVSMIVSNAGDREGRNAKFKIDWKTKSGGENNKNDLILVSPANNVQSGTPKLVDPSGISEAKWDVMAKRRMVGDSITICITASFDNHDSVKCCKSVWVPPADAVLSCSVTAPTIKADRVNQRYSPMPFPIDVIVTNEGGKKTDSVFATIIVPPDLRLYGPDAPNNNTKRVLPSVIGAGLSGSVGWVLWHPITMESKEYKIVVWVKTANADSTSCEVTVIIPPLEAPILTPSCTTPKDLKFNEALDAYEPNPFTVTLTCVNRGGLPAYAVTGYIYIPDGVVLENPSEPLRKAFPSPMNEYKVGDPIPSISWNLMYTKKLRYNSTLFFKFVVGGLGPNDLQTDSVEVWCKVEVPGLAPSFACSFTAPDSIALNSSETNVEPNPFTVTYKVWNTSRQVANIVLVDVNYPLGEGLTLDPTTPKTRNINITLNPGEDASFDWIFHVQNRITRRNINIYGVAWDDEGNPITSGPNGVCGKIIPIANLKTSLLCDIQTDESVIKYIPILQEYTPTKWILTATLTNSGGFDLTDVEAELELEDSTYAYMQMFDPVFLDNTNPKTTPVLFVGTSRTFKWGLQLADKNNTAQQVILNYNIRYKSKETPYVESGCFVQVIIEPVVMPKLECELIAPDTIYFNDNKYEPSPFNAYIKVSNIGTGIAYSTRAYLLQDTRFNIKSHSNIDYGDLDANTSIDFYDDVINKPFTLKVNARQNDGYDTIRAVVVADGIPASYCYIPVFVKKENRPVFEIHCKAIPDIITFDEATNDYLPNPFNVDVTVINVGDANAYNCQLVFVGPPKFTPADNTSIINLGTINIGDTATYTWKVKPLRRNTSGYDKLIYQIQGRGGLENRLFVEQCEADIFVPSVRSAEYKIVCSAPVSLVFDNSSGAYIPDPFEFKTIATNTGKALGQNVAVSIMLPTGVTLASGESSIKYIGDLNVNEFVEVKWLIKPISTDVAKTVSICARAYDTLMNESQCCSDVLIPPATKAALALTCDATPDVLIVNNQRGEYEVNPINVYVTITNNGTRPADNVTVWCQPNSNELKVLGDMERFVALRLDVGKTTDTINWQVYAIPRSQSGYIDIQFVVSADNIASSQCIKSVLVPEIGKPILDCNSINSTATNDTLNFDYTIGDYRDEYGTRSSTGKYNIFTIDADIRNIGSAQATRAIATILLSENMTLDDGEESKKQLGNITIGPNNFSKVSWNIKPIRQSYTTNNTISIILSSDNTPNYRCNYNMFIDGAPKIVKLRLPNNLVGKFGNKIIVPVYIDTTIGKDVYQYNINIAYNTRLVKFVDVSSINTLTAFGWAGPMYNITNNYSADKNIVTISDFTTGAPLNTRSECILIALIFEVVYNDANALNAIADNLEFIDIFVNSAGKTIRGTINDGKEIQIQYENGIITVSGDCIVPVEGSSNFYLAQNKPNPVSNYTDIEYCIPTASNVRLELYDNLGKMMTVLVDCYNLAGKTIYKLNTEDLSSGTYNYRMIVGNIIFTKTMLITK
jgi:hypothetical protein